LEHALPYGIDPNMADMFRQVSTQSTELFVTSSSPGPAALGIPDQRFAHENHRQEMRRRLPKGIRPSDAAARAIQFCERLPLRRNVGILSHQTTPASVDPMIRYRAGFPFPVLTEVIS
jgi:hypothetical protein